MVASELLEAAEFDRCTCGIPELKWIRMPREGIEATVLLTDRINQKWLTNRIKMDQICNIIKRQFPPVSWFPALFLGLLGPRPPFSLFFCTRLGPRSELLGTSAHLTRALRLKRHQKKPKNCWRTSWTPYEIGILYNIIKKKLTLELISPTFMEWQVQWLKTYRINQNHIQYVPYIDSRIWSVSLLAQGKGIYPSSNIYCSSKHFFAKVRLDALPTQNANLLVLIDWKPYALPNQSNETANLSTMLPWCLTQTCTNMLPACITLPCL